MLKAYLLNAVLKYVSQAMMNFSINLAVGNIIPYRDIYLSL